jgi:hypothetical protein
MILGDKVVLITDGNTYSTYDTMFKLMGFNNKIYNPPFDEGEEAVIFSMCPHVADPKRGMLYGIRNADGKECLTGERGIVLKKSYHKTPQGILDTFNPKLIDGKKYYRESDVIMYATKLLLSLAEDE